jgi:DNA (cytosine-5)-methyltransferase 1
MSLKFIDLCCGIGGFHQALSKMDHECVLACDIDKNCREIYEINYNVKPDVDLCKLDIESIPDFDILCAGFPCQPFSKAGSQSGFKDSRGNIFFDICKIIDFHKPKYIILENVRNLVSHDGGKTFNIILSTLEDLNYDVKHIILNALYFSVPQHRERILIMCKRKDIGCIPELPKFTKKRVSLESIIDKTNQVNNLTDKLNASRIIWNDFLLILSDNKIHVPKFPIWTDIWDSDVSDKFYNMYKSTVNKNKQFFEDNSDILQNWLEESRCNELWKGSVRKLEWQTGTDNGTLDETLWSPRGSGIRAKKIDYSPTLVAMCSMIPIYGPYSRHLTPRECARLQSFPESYILHKDPKVNYKQFGNAVNVKMISWCVSFLIN